jgi:hypothetical protein
VANVLSIGKKIAVIGALAEGSSIRSIERITGVHRDTIMRLGVKVGQGCTAMMDPKRHVTVLRVPPVESPITAVRAAIMQEFRDAQTA